MVFGRSPEWETLIKDLGLEWLYGETACYEEPGPEPQPPENVSRPAEEEVCRLPDLDDLPWNREYVTKLEFMGFVGRSTVVLDSWFAAIKEIEAGPALWKQVGAKTIETVVGAPPILSGKFSKDNAEALAWVRARSNELMWQAFEETAAKGTFPDYHKSGSGGLGGPSIHDEILENGGYRKNAEQLREGFLGAGSQKVAVPGSTEERFVSADGQREVRIGTDGVRETVQFLKRNGDSVDVVELWLT